MTKRFCQDEKRQTIGVLDENRLALFKACVCYFYQIFIFSPNDSPSKTMKNAFYFIKKALFDLQIIKFFYFRPSLLFLPVGHCFRGWLKINLKVYDTINCLNKNSVSFCLISWEGKKVSHRNFIHRGSIKKRTFLWKNHAENMQ